ncbi:uncharacterized protein LOC114328558 [Diabrotica virgifera virgifera]|uniref:Uncharacterized protein LOC114328558 isoform X1 n=1 Tax=Diabrotica virgifera virgifera TaxID=50390 RepID=A0A6P7FJ54_DIAVI|nr:uncharacterized protein LOC114328558 [Diabrotica virgifera virgifera]
MLLRLSVFFLWVFIQRSTGSPLHGGCTSSEDCGTIDTYCKNETCVCRDNFAVWYDSCVQMPTPALRCSKKQECHKSLGARSMCTKKGQCACKPFHHIHSGQCVKNRDLHDQCEHDHQCYCGAECQGKIACIHKSCACKPGHRPYKIRRCILDPAYIDIPSIYNLTSSTPRTTTTSIIASATTIMTPVATTVFTVDKNKSEDQAEHNEPMEQRASTSRSSSSLVSGHLVATFLLVTALNM